MVAILYSTTLFKVYWVISYFYSFNTLHLSNSVHIEYIVLIGSDLPNDRLPLSEPYGVLYRGARNRLCI